MVCNVTYENFRELELCFWKRFRRYSEILKEIFTSQNLSDLICVGNKW